MVNDLHNQYDAFATTFVEGTAIHNDKSRAAYYSAIDFPLKGKRVLDIGCGDGYDLAQLNKRGAQCTGIDASMEMVKLATRNVPGAHLDHGRMEQLPYADNSFDAVLSKYALQTSNDLGRAIGEMDRVLRPGGMMAYLATHPLRQFLEKKKHPKDYFLQEIVESRFFGGAVSAHEPTHTMQEYLNPAFLHRFRLLHFSEHPDFPSSEQVDGDTYPCFFVVKAQKME